LGVVSIVASLFTLEHAVAAARHDADALLACPASLEKTTGHSVGNPCTSSELVWRNTLVVDLITSQAGGAYATIEAYACSWCWAATETNHTDDHSEGVQYS
jgi:hypothetical protein